MGYFREFPRGSQNLVAPGAGLDGRKPVFDDIHTIGALFGYPVPDRCRSGAGSQFGLILVPFCSPVCSPVWSQFSSNLVPVWSQLSPSWVPVGSQFAPSLVSFWSPVGSQFGPSLVPVGSQWGPSWVPVGSQLGPSWVRV